MSIYNRVRDLINWLEQTHSLSKDELLFLLQNLDEQNKQLLFAHAVKTRQKYYNDKVYLRGLIEFSNICRQDCVYCGLRVSNTKVQRYRLTVEEILACCMEGYDLGYRTFVLQSGEDAWYTVDILSKIIHTIKARFPDVALTLSIGERSIEEYKTLFEAGADRFLLRHETASRELYNRLHPSMQFDNRRSCLEALREIGYQVGAGFMVGLPGQGQEELVEDLCYLKELNPHMVGIGPFIPHPDTPLKDEPGGTVEQTLVLVALTRLLLPDCLLPATTALGTLHPNGRELAIQAGANVVMPILTPTRVRKSYALYQDRICADDDTAHCRNCIENRIKSVGCEADLSRGDSWRLSC